MTSLLWGLVAIQIAMGVFDTFYHHEFFTAWQAIWPTSFCSGDNVSSRTRR
jgi:hypothetical protein